MIRNLKALGLALVAVFAMSAVAASAAQAVEAEATFSWEAETTKLEAVADPTDPSQIFKTTAGTVTCDTVYGTVDVTGKNNQSTITSKDITYTDTKLENEGKKDTCTGPIGTQPKIEMNGCGYQFHAGTTLKSAPTGETEGTVDIVCEAGKGPIKIVAPGCNINVPEQAGLGPVYFRTVTTAEGGKEHVTIEAKVGDPGVPPATHLKTIKYNHNGFLCGTGEGADGTYTGKVTVNGRKGAAISHATVT